MFTGIVQGMGAISSVRHHAGGLRLGIDNIPFSPPRTGDSICVSGVCLTVASVEDNKLFFDVISETLDKTSLGGLNVTDCVNLEPSLRVGDRLDGHFVQGHIDGTAIVERVIESAEEHVVWLRPQTHLLPCIVPKGSVAIDGVSMTVAALQADLFSIALIPTTIERTTLGSLRAGDRVNIETDILARTIVHALQQMFPHAACCDLSEAVASQNVAAGRLEPRFTKSIRGGR